VLTALKKITRKSRARQRLSRIRIKMALIIFALSVDLNMPKDVTNGRGKNDYNHPLI
jgi:hypothetical protein